MPNYYAHSIFGQKVCAAADPALRRVIDQQWESYACGQYGPDPLFFYQVWHHNPVKQEGHAIHNISPATVLERLRRPIEKGAPFALGYALGFLCHFLLDSSCHPYIRTVSERGSISHLAMEGEFDRYLMRLAGINPRKATPLEQSSHPEVFTAAAWAYEHVSPKQFQQSMKGFYFVARLLTRFQGTVLCPAMDLVTKGHKSAARILLRREPAKASLITSLQLQDQLNSAVEPAAILLGRLYDAYQKGTAIDFLPPMNFQGEPLEELYTANMA